MSHPAPEGLEGLAADVRDMPVMPAAEIRARGRRRARRRIAAVTAAGAVAAVTAGVAFAWPPSRQQQATLPGAGQPTSSAVACVLTLPNSTADVRIRVSDSGVAADLRERRFTVLDGTAEPVQATTLRYGPPAIGAATVLRAAVHGEVAMQFDPGRGDDVIDLLLGPDFVRLASPTEMNQSLAQAGRPTAPPQCP